MFIRLKKRRLTGSRNTGRAARPHFAHDAVLVESVRSQHGPRLRYVKHLATIRSDHTWRADAVNEFYSKISLGLTEAGVTVSPTILKRIKRTIRLPNAKQEEARKQRSAARYHREIGRIVEQAARYRAEPG
jgi:hypothetical protein